MQQENNKGKLVILSAPSGSGKTTIVKQLMRSNLNLNFSISATTRKPRGDEKDGREYYFISPDRFKFLIAQGAFVEYEEVYENLFYGTLVSEVDRIFSEGYTPLFDIDVMGGLSIKQRYYDEALAIFIMPPSIEELKRRLIYRGTDTNEVVEKRIQKAEWEISFSDKFDKIIINDILKDAVNEVYNLIDDFLKG